MGRILEDTGLSMPKETALIAATRVHTAQTNANLGVVIRLNNGKFFTSTFTDAKHWT